MLKNSSVSIAKNRLRTLVISDRVQCTPSAYEHICKDLYETLSKYMELTEDDFQVEINRSQIVIKIAGEENVRSHRFTKPYKFKKLQIWNRNTCRDFVCSGYFSCRQCKGITSEQTDSWCYHRLYCNDCCFLN